MELIQSDKAVVTSIFKHIQDEVIAHGYMPNPALYGDTQTDAQNYYAARQTVKVTQGFEIEVFNNSSARRKAEKKSPRIVIYQSRTYAGEIGAPIHAILVNDTEVGGQFKSGFMPQMASSVVVAIHLISAVSNQFSILNSILGNVIGQRQYLPLYDIDQNVYLEKRFLAEQTSFNDADDPLEGVFEKIFFYTVPDVYLSPMSNVRVVKPITQINLNTPGDDLYLQVEE